MRIEGWFYLGARMAPWPSGVAAAQGGELNLTANSTETTGKGYTASIIPLTLQLSCSSSARSRSGQLGGGRRHPAEPRLCTIKTTTNLGRSSCWIFLERSFPSTPVSTEISACLWGRFHQPRTLPSSLCTHLGISEP